MADITICTDELCSRRFSCYRFTAPVNPWRQSYFAESPRKGEECTEYWENKGRRLDNKFTAYERPNK